MIDTASLLHKMAIRDMNTAPPLTLDSVICLSDHQLSCRVAKETVVLETTAGMYYGLNEVAAFVWERIKTPTKVWAVRDAVQEEFEVATEECERDLLALVKDLRENGLINVQQ